LFSIPLTRLCHQPPTLLKAFETHAISCSKNFKVLLLFLSTVVVVPKSECKDTTFFETAKFFFHFFLLSKFNKLNFNTKNFEFFFAMKGKTGAKMLEKRKKNHFLALYDIIAC
jgi:hypothetical protein